MNATPQLGDDAPVEASDTKYNLVLHGRVSTLLPSWKLWITMQKMAASLCSEHVELSLSREVLCSHSMR